MPHPAARTATHIHEAAVGRAGPPRLAFENPAYRANGKLQSLGCLIGTFIISPLVSTNLILSTGPFTTGLNAANTTTDTAAGFKVKQIEDSPESFFAGKPENIPVVLYCICLFDHDFRCPYLYKPCRSCSRTTCIDNLCTQRYGRMDFSAIL